MFEFLTMGGRSNLKEEKINMHLKKNPDRFLWTISVRNKIVFEVNKMKQLTKGHPNSRIQRARKSLR